jgi:dTDP-4-amino-4,6-dideoxygalactose transaminase
MKTKSIVHVPFVDLKAQYAFIRPEIDAVIRQLIESTHFILGPDCEKFEKSFASLCRAKYCAGVSSGTSALFLALKAAGIGPGDEVIVPSHTFIATAEAVTETGAKVRFCDIDPSSYCMDPDSFEKSVTKKTRAVIAVHLNGRMAEMDRICLIAAKKRIIVFEDAAQSHMASHRGRGPGQWGKAACFSFYPGKNLGAYGDAGAVITNDKKLADKIRQLANHGRLSKYHHLIEGYNHRMDTMQAAILNVKMKYLRQWTEARRRAAAVYSEALRDIVTVPVESRDSRPVYHLYVIRVPADRRDGLLKHLGKNGIGCGIHYPIPLHLQPAYKYLGYKKGSLPATEKAVKEIISLPIYPEISEEQQCWVIENVRRFLIR